MTILDWIQQHGSPVDVIIVLMGVGVVLVGRYFVNRQDKINELRREDERLIWTELKEAIRLYNQVDKLEAVNSLAIRILSDPGAPIETMKQSADGKGDHTINRDV